jgi:flagellar biosynthesis chaperone FliJ
MTRFVWRLQRVLDVRAKQEQIKRTELFRVTEELAARRSELLMRQRILQDLIRSVQRERTPERLNAQEFVLRQATTNDEQIRKTKEQIMDLEVRQKEKTSELLTVRRAREALERLRTEARERFLREQDKQEQKQQDDRTTGVYARQASAETKE